MKTRQSHSFVGHPDAFSGLAGYADGRVRSWKVVANELVWSSNSIYVMDEIVDQIVALQEPGRYIIASHSIQVYELSEMGVEVLWADPAAQVGGLCVAAGGKAVIAVSDTGVETRLIDVAARRDSLVNAKWHFASSSFDCMTTCGVQQSPNHASLTIVVWDGLLPREIASIQLPGLVRDVAVFQDKVVINVVGEPLRVWMYWNDRIEEYWMDTLRETLVKSIVPLDEIRYCCVEVVSKEGVNESSDVFVIDAEHGGKMRKCGAGIGRGAVCQRGSVWVYESGVVVPLIKNM